MTWRVAMCGIGTESSTFAEHRTTTADFTVWRGGELAARYPFLDDVVGVEFVPLMVARALPGGPVTAETYDALERELLDRLAAAGPFDAVYLDLHGAMHVEGRFDIEADLVAGVRSVVGETCLVAASMDLHGQVSRRFARLVDLPTAYRTAPHVDVEETRERACRLLARCLAEGISPVRAWVRVPLLLPGEKTSTRLEPALSLYARLGEIDRRPGVLDASTWVGYAWADEPRSSVAVLVSGTAEAAVREAAEALARAWWAARDGFAFCVPAGTPEWAVGQALHSPARPYFVSDSGDNPTAGGSGDATAMLSVLLATPELASGTRSAIWASCVAPEAVAACVAAGEGADVDLRLSGERLRGTVTRLLAGDPVGGDLAVVRSGGVSAVLTSRRKPFHFVADLTALGLDPAAHDVTVVKIGYLEPDLYRAAAGSVLALTPGAVNQDLLGLVYHHLNRPIHPLDEGFSPDLTPELFRG
ncbi:M81 family metallopeptidase [Nonomuraea africana]|uniref:M81 family metallopeptidase n=1 Tax=Nonomuraea africana TaxID=46171 RepID=UPI0033E05BEF